MKTFVVSLMMFAIIVANAQNVRVQAGQSLLPASHLSLRYEHWTNGTFNLSLGGFYEQSRKNKLHYSCYGLDLLGEYASNREGYSAGPFGLRYGLGATSQIENDPWIYKDWPLSKRFNYGLLAEISGEWFMTDIFTLRAGIQQKILFNPSLGHYRFLLGLGLAWKLNTY